MSVNLLPFVQEIVQKKLTVYNLCVRQNGKIAGEFHWRTTHRRENICSAAKSITSIAVGIAIDENLLTMDTKPVDVLRGLLPDDYDEKWNRVTVRHLLTMSAGHKVGLLPGYSFDPEKPNRDYLQEKNWLNYIFRQPVDYEPGTRFCYSNACPYLLSRMMKALTGENLLDWCRSRLFDPLDFQNPQWMTDPEGNTLGCGGIMMNAEELGRFGQLCLDGGIYQGKRIVSEKYIREACSWQIDNFVSGQLDQAMPKDIVAEERGDNGSGYGYYIWMAAHENAYYFAGWGGQYAIMLPRQNAVVSMMSHEFDAKSVLNAVWSYLVPELEVPR